MKNVRRVLGFIVLLAAGSIASADVKLPALFSDHMVLQRDVSVPVWGWADAGEQISVSIAGQRHTATADAGGNWMIRLDKLAVGEPLMLTVTGKNTITLTDVLAGEVWLCSGQSNMDRQLGPRPAQPLIVNWEQEAAAADFPQIRHFGVGHKIPPAPGTDVTGAWVVCSPQSVKDFTAIGYFFGRELHQDLKVPIGLIRSTWGGTAVATWTSRKALDSIPEFAEKTREKLKELESAKDYQPGSQTPSKLFDSLIAPLMPFAIRGVIWAQGENRAGIDVDYTAIFELMITDWRTQWSARLMQSGAPKSLGAGQGDFPFYFVQLPKGSPQIREAQAAALRLPHTGMVVTLDVGGSDVHCPNKAPIGHRLARLALVNDYGRAGESSSPQFASAVFNGSEVHIQFTHTTGGLVSKDGGPLKNFLIAGEDKKFFPADAVIVGDEVVVSSAKIPKPVAVRYAWSAVASDANLFSGAGFPAGPFRTDKW